MSYATWQKLKTVLQTGPQEEPVSLAQAKRFLRVQHDLDDADITGLIEDARERAERVTGRQLVTATWAMYLDRLPCEIRVPYPRLQAVSSIQYVDQDGDTQTLAASLYDVDTASEPGVISRAYGASWPVVKSSTPNVVTIAFTAGYGSAGSVPAGLKQRILNAVAHCYTKRVEGVDEQWLDGLFLPWWVGTYR